MEIKSFCGGIGAGIMVGIGGAIFLSCADKTVGAILFSVALLSICLLGMYLYTGKIGMLAEDMTAKNALQLPIGLLGNYIGATLTGVVLSFVRPNLYEAAKPLAAAKTGNTFVRLLILGLFCGILMYTAVKIYAAKGTVIGILFCIPVFILCGFEHSIADMFYLAAARQFGWQSLRVLLAVVLGNTAGGLLLPLLLHTRKPKEA